MVIDPGGRVQNLSNISELDLKIGLIVVTTPTQITSGPIARSKKIWGQLCCPYSPRPKSCSIMTLADSLLGIRPSKSHRYQQIAQRWRFFSRWNLKFQVLHTQAIVQAALYCRIWRGLQRGYTVQWEHRPARMVLVATPIC